MESIGARLKDAREKRKISLAKAAEVTKIHARILAALEEEKFGEVFNPTYIKAFLKKYADYLGLPGGDIVNEYLATEPKKPKQILTLKPAAKPSVDYTTRYLIPFVMLLTFIVVVVLSYLAAANIKGLIEKKKRMAPAAPPISLPEVSLPEIIKGKEAKKEVPPPRAVTPSAEAEPLKLVVSAKRKVWIQARADGKIVFQEILAAGKKITWEAEDKIILWVGDAGGLNLNLNGEDLGIPGFGVIRDITITHEGVKIPSRKKR